VATLARWNAARSVISFERQLQTWLHWFQFTRARHDACAGCHHFG